MLEVHLEKNEKLFLGNKFFIVKKGKVIVKNLLENGDIIVNESYVQVGEIIGNLFLLTEINYLKLPNIEIEIESLEKVILEEINISKKEIFSNLILKKVFSQLIKQYIIKFLSHAYDAQRFILSLLRLNCDLNGIILKENINYEYFNISKSQYYLVLSNIKKQNLIKEDNKKFILDLKKIDKILSLNEIIKNCI